MNKWFYFGIVSILVVAGGVVFLLLQGADLPNRANNGFDRKLEVNFSKPIVDKKLGRYITRISGLTKDCIYFSGENPSWVIKVDYELNVIDTLVYGVEAGNDLISPLITIDSPNIYMYATSKAYFLKGLVDSMRMDTLKLESELITRLVQLSENRLLTRGIDSTQTKQVFRIMDCVTGKVVRETEVIKNQQFGGFEADGILKYDRDINRIVYVQMFQNRIYCLDTLLNVLGSYNTIDTTFTNSVNTGLVNEGGATKIMATKPRVVVNKCAEVFKNRIFVVSGLRGDNEKLADFNKYMPVDMYDASSGKYISSVRVPKYDGQNIIDLKVTDKYWIILYSDGRCVIFDLDKHE